MNLQSDQYAKNKGYCEDLTEGKFSFPVIHSIRADPTNRQLLGILKQRSNDDEIKSYAVKYMRDKTGSLDYTVKVVKDLHRQATELLETFEENPLLRAIFEKMVL